MLSVADIAKARERVDIIAGDVALRRAGQGMVGLCPLHKEKTPSFYVYDKGDHATLHCFGCGFHGTVIDYVMARRNLNFPDAVREILGMPPQRERQAVPYVAPRAPAEDDAAALTRVKELLAGAKPIAEGDLAWLYLWSRLPTYGRGVSRRMSEGLLFHPAVYCAERKAELPALLAPITRGDGEVTAVQRIWLRGGPFVEGDNRAQIAVRKKTLGRMGDGAVRVGPWPIGTLGIAEGVETAIAVRMLFKVACWAACGAARMGQVWIPPEIDHVIVFGDNGEAGHALGLKAQAAIARAGVAASIMFPIDGFDDFNDQLQGRAR